MTKSEIREYKYLHRILIGNDSFVEPDYNNPQWVRYNELVGKYLRLSRVH